jgi:hypothetical protein
MKKFCGCLLGLALAAALASVAPAQEKKAGVMAPPKVLNISREFVKPGKGGPPHDRSESAFVKAMTAAKWPTQYLGLDSLSGKARSLFLTGYDSFDAWEKDVKATAKNATLSAALGKAFEADGALLDGYDQSVWMFREDLSRNPGADIAHTRYFEFEVFKIKPGHEEDWYAGVKLVQDAYAKGIPEGHWDMFQLVYGGSPEFVVITPLKSAAEIDKNFASGKQFADALGTDGMKKLNELSAASFESFETHLFAVNPHMSYVDEETAKQDPEFWRPKSATSGEGKPKAGKAEAKPATP